MIECCNRPWTYEEQDAEIVRRWNSRVGLFDEVYHLGDFTFAGRKKANAIIEQIKAYYVPRSSTHGVVGTALRFGVSKSSVSNIIRSE
ncbi:hypothetical protein vB_PsyM_KIL4_0019 [Pseudomonas phage vB_PsyM_KIL4]|uniref:Uncharacterized protein n=2 Tax=Flaumdravirus TaxID=2560133 RepID=A0A142IEU7_9CAUD|nr:hypothetical protein FDI83_gp019 [Pseudomonas phage vB_PsyM_KIL4]AMR57752.1 hypothetical protein vB_PsyM_KIL4_0019 [Pseudomonas phage vB_PsyM_KIL4]AMR57919.1 hypothetical protein vB_PsyM_KIL5_0019 [Pseudomonas phage vB_PsyM_KIL5]